jgi:hypothetical protein
MAKGRPNAVETSQFRKEIEEWILEGKTIPFIMNFLEKNNAPISESTLRRYKKNYNPHLEAVQEYNNKESEARFDNAKTKIVSDLEFCDNIIQLADEVDLKVDHDNKITELDIKKLGLQAIRTKQEIFNKGSEDEKEFRIIIEAVDSDEDDTMETQQETSE